MDVMMKCLKFFKKKDIHSFLNRDPEMMDIHYQFSINKTYF